MSNKIVLKIWFGVPGSGKTTMVAHRAKKYQKKGIPVYSNVPIIDTYILNPKKDLGTYQIENCSIQIDEASIDFNNRQFKSFPTSCIEFFKLHRHYNVSIDVYSQSYDDMDITLKRLAQEYIIVRKSIFPFFISYRKIGKHITIEKEKEQVIDGYYWKPFSRRWIFMPPLWKMFNSYQAPIYKQKDFKKWGFDDLKDFEKDCI